MRLIVGAMLTALGLCGPAAAQDWITQGSPAEGWTSAVTCVPGRDGAITALCLSLACESDGEARAVLSVSEAILPPEVRVTLTIDGEVLAPLEFRLDRSGITYDAPLERGHRLIEALRNGRGAAVRLDFRGGGIVHPLSLGGSRAAIDQALATCAGTAPAALPADLLGSPPEARTSADPAAEAVADNDAFCPARAVVEPGLVRETDLDGDGRRDLILDFVGLSCDGSRGFCGSGGCTQEIWLADTAGGYRLLISSLIEEIVPIAPGEVLFRLDGAECGLAGAELCERTYAVRDGLLVPVD